MRVVRRVCAFVPVPKSSASHRPRKPGEGAKFNSAWRICAMFRRAMGDEPSGYRRRRQAERARGDLCKDFLNERVM